MQSAPKPAPNNLIIHRSSLFRTQLVMMTTRYASPAKTIMDSKKYFISPASCRLDVWIWSIRPNPALQYSGKLWLKQGNTKQPLRAVLLLKVLFFGQYRARKIINRASGSQHNIRTYPGSIIAYRFQVNLTFARVDYVVAAFGIIRIFQAS